MPESLESVINQTFTDWECIIVNDGSSDNTCQVVYSLISKYPNNKIQLINQENKGLAEARNAGIRASTGKYILPLDADDLIRQEMLQKTVFLLETHPEIAIAYTDVKHFGCVDKIDYAGEYNFKKLCIQNHLNYCSLYRREAWEAADGYNPNMIWGYEDWDFWITCGEKGFYGKRIPEPLFLYRVKESSMYTKALRFHSELMSQIVLNHPNLYSTNTIADAKTILEKCSYKKLQSYPCVSIIVPTYNRPDTLKTTLDSIAAQTYKNIEALVVNDAGKDVSGVIDTFRNRLSIKYFVHNKNKGLAASRNTGINAAKGKYIAYLDDDDIFYPDHIETLVNLLENSGYKVAYTDAYRAHQEKEDERYVIKQKDIPYSFDFDPNLILAQNLFPVLCIMHERSCTDEVGLFDESLTTHEDWDLWIRMSRKYRFAHIKRITCEFTWKTDSTTMSSEKRSDFLRTMVIIYKRYWEFSKDKQRVLELQRECIRRLQLELKQALNRCYPRVSIIIPVFNKIELTRKSIESIVKNTTKESYEIIIVDNASTDGTKEFLCSLNSNIKIIVNEINLGFARACNKGSQKASTDYLLFLNNDTEPKKGWLEPLLEVLTRDNSVAAAGSKLLFPNETIQHAGVVIADNKTVNDPLLATHIYANETANLPEANQLRTYQALTAACLLIRKSAFNEVGGFDEDYWNGYEDVDLCFKLQERGWKLVYQPESVVIHHESKSGPERFIKVKENIRRLHDKWLGKIMPDIIIKEDGSTIITGNNKIQRYSIPDVPTAGESNIKPQKLVSIIILTWNALEYTKKCIESIFNYTHYPFEVIFVDNGSIDGTSEYLHTLIKEHSNCKLIENQENKGFAAGNNQGVKMAGGEYIMLINNDVLVSEGWLESLVESLEKDEKIGMVGPITNSISGRQQVKDVPYADGTIDSQKDLRNNTNVFSASSVRSAVKDGFFDEKGFHRFAQSIQRNFKGRLTPRHRIAGFAVLMKKSLYEEVGGLDESFGTGNYEDDDLCLKVRQKGYAIMVDESVFIHHYRSQTFKENNINYRNSIALNDTLFRKKWLKVNYEELLEIHKTLVDINAELVKKGQQALQSGKTEEAFKCYTKVINTNPIDEAAVYGIALVYQMENKIDEAIRPYKKSIKINPVFYDAYYNLGFLYATISDIDNAIAALSKAVEIHNNDASVYNNLGVLYFKKKQNKEARSCFEKALAIDPDYQEAKQNLDKVL
ncbi:MAG: glycosyltransferase [Candidatus Kuenenia sp.]|nr:glycosyltransferase [Candidatus Kuenenia hertensis]